MEFYLTNNFGRCVTSYFESTVNIYEVIRRVNYTSHTFCRSKGSINPIMFTEVFALSRRKTPSVPPDRLLAQLDKVEQQLQQWIALSPENADWFKRDPLGAMRAAGLNIEDDILLELELITKAIAKKLK